MTILLATASIKKNYLFRRTLATFRVSKIVDNIEALSISIKCDFVVE